MRGEHTVEGGHGSLPTGSSPLARGTPVCHFFILLQLGIIPACAGNTISLNLPLRSSQDHPRLRGEHVQQGTVLRGHSGSSPLARGTRPNLRTDLPCQGIIPACAGNTSMRRMIRLGSRDHPRLRGEHSTPSLTMLSWWGSSPLARGTHDGVEREDGEDGIIPACAGNTRRRTPSSSPDGDHPRLRGEHAATGLFYESEGGSSPLARGTRDDAVRGTDATGIIPACAGNTPSSEPPLRGLQDHPRLRGEHAQQEDPRGPCGGSSPLARGTLRQRLECIAIPGIIPACAGNTNMSCARTDREQDHPRLRGEHSMTLLMRLIKWGSSPLARGTRDDPSHPQRPHGIIPACAGNTPCVGTIRCWSQDHPRLRGEHTKTKKCASSGRNFVRVITQTSFSFTSVSTISFGRRHHHYFNAVQIEYFSFGVVGSVIEPLFIVGAVDQCRLSVFAATYDPVP